MQVSKGKHLFIEGVAGFMNGACEALCQVVLLESGSHPHIRRVRTCSQAQNVPVRWQIRNCR